MQAADEKKEDAHLKKGRIGKFILKSNLDFNTKRVWYYLEKNYPATLNSNNQNEINLAAWQINENSFKIYRDLNIDKVEFLRHLRQLKQVYHQWKKLEAVSMEI